MDAVDLGLLQGKPTLTGSVQKMYSVWEGGTEYLLSEAVDDGSVFDIGRFFLIPESGKARNTLRHQIFTAMRNPAQWDCLRVNDKRFSDKAYLDKLYRSPIMAKLKLEGALTHHVGAVNSVTGRIAASSTAESSALVLIERVPVVKPLRTHLHDDSVYDYTNYIQAASKVLALEQIVRLGLPGGSAVLRRFNELGGVGSARAETHIARYGVVLPLMSWSSLSRPICDWQSKYEDHDRNLDPQEALYISGISAGKLSAIGDLLMLCSLMADSILSRGGLTLWDLKWEVALRDGEPMIVDTMDHDSMRITHALMYEGKVCNIHFNKQAIRDYYKIFHPDWIRAINDAKESAERDAGNRPFIEIYTDGIKSGKYPSISPLDASYADLQAAKYQYVTDIARGSADERVGLDLAQRELTYYKRRGRLAELIEYVAAAAPR